MNSLPVGRDDDSHRLRDDHLAQDLRTCHAERPAGELLARVDREQAGSDDLGHVRGLVQREREPGGEERREPVAGEHAPDLRQRVPDEVELQQRRRRAEEPVVDPGQRAEPPPGAERAERDEEADHDRGRERDDGQLERGQRSPPVGTGGERRPEEMRVEAREHEPQPRRTTSRRRPGSCTSRRAALSVPFAFSFATPDLELRSDRVALAVVDAEGVLCRERVRRPRSCRDAPWPGRRRTCPA